MTWEVVAAYRRGWSRLQFTEKPVYRQERPLRYWVNIATHATIALLGAWVAVVIGRGH